MAVIDPAGRKDAIKPMVARKMDDNWYVEYTPLVEGVHSINIFFAGKPIPTSPYPVLVSHGKGRTDFTLTHKLTNDFADDGNEGRIIYFIFTALHEMQTRSSDENSVRLSVRLSVRRVIPDKMEERSVQIFIPYERTFSLVF